jgi:hypothetical protein
MSNVQYIKTIERRSSGNFCKPLKTETMKTVVKPSLVQMEADALRSLLTEVKETVAMGFNMPQEKKVFTINNMWNIRRNAKSASSMIRIKR